MIERDVVKMMSLQRLFINSYRQSKNFTASALFGSNKIWMNTNSEPSSDQLDIMIFERWLVSNQLLSPNSFEALEAIMDQTFEGDSIDFRI